MHICVWYIDAHTFIKKFLSYDSSYFKFWFLFEVTKLKFILHFNLFIFWCINIVKKIFLIYSKSAFYYFLAWWWEKYLWKRSPLKHTCSWRDKLIVLLILNRQAKVFLRITVLPFEVKYGKWKKKKEKTATPALTWEVLRTAKAYSNIAKMCSSCLHEKLAIITYPYRDELLNRRSELITKCRHTCKRFLFILDYFHVQFFDFNIDSTINAETWDAFVLLATM